MPESLVEAAEIDSDGLTKDKVVNILVQFSEPPTGSRFTASGRERAPLFARTAIATNLWIILVNRSQ